MGILYLVATFLPIFLVGWEVWSMRRRCKVRFGLRAMFWLTASAAVLCALGHYTNWSSDAIVIGGGIILGIAAILLLIRFAFEDVFPRRRLTGDEADAQNANIAPPATRTSKPPKRKRGPATDQQPNFGRYGMWK